MCGLCGILSGSEHWTQGSLKPDGGDNVLRDRRRQAEAANRVLSLLGLRLSTWQDGYLLRDGKGKTALVGHLGELWDKAERMSAKRCDPLDPLLLDTLGARKP